MEEKILYMKIKFADKKTGEVVFERTLTESQQKFWYCDKETIVLNGGMGCIDGKTKIMTDRGAIPIEVLYQYNIAPVVYSLKNDKVMKIQATIPVQYPKEPLYEIITEIGRFTATKKHKVLTPNGWKPIYSLRCGDKLKGVSPYFQETNLGFYPSVQFSNVRHFGKRVPDFQFGYRSLCRSCGGLLRFLSNIFQVLFPLQVGVHEYNRFCYSGVRVSNKEYNRQRQSFYRPSSIDSFLPFDRQLSVSEDYILKESSESALFQDQFCGTFPKKTNLLEKLKSSSIRLFSYLYDLLRSYPNPTPKWINIQEIRYLKTDIFYDICVPETHNYLAEGIFHHNSGKTEPMLMRVIYECINQPDNYFLLGRETYQEIYDVLLKDFLDICHPSWIKEYKKSPHPTIVLYTIDPTKTSTIIFRNMDKMSEMEIKGLNLGGFAIDQAERVSENVVKGLMMRLRRKNIKYRVFFTKNPFLDWIYRKINIDKDQDWIQFTLSTPENYKNLPKETVERYEKLMTTDPSYYNQYVLGIENETLFAENTVFPKDHLLKLSKGIKEPIRTFEGANIYREKEEGHRYQLGIDCAEGVEGGDNAAICVADLDTLEEVASWAGKLPPEAVADKAVVLAEMYSGDWRKCLIVPEMNSQGLALLQKLRELGYERIYQREEYDKKTGKPTLKLGWRTTSQTKPLLVSNFRHLLRNFDISIHTKEAVDEFRIFVYSDEAKQKGMGAVASFHDDRVIATLLAFWERTRRDPKAEIIRHINKRFPILTIPTVVIVNGMVKSTQREFRNNNWKIK